MSPIAAATSRAFPTSVWMRMYAWTTTRLLFRRFDAGSPVKLPQRASMSGDDAAVVAAPDRRVVATTDVLVEGRHFRRDWSSARDVGHRAAAANLADVAAMGAVPTALLVGLCAPADLEVAWAEELADGLAD